MFDECLIGNAHKRGSSGPAGGISHRRPDCLILSGYVNFSANTGYRPVNRELTLLKHMFTKAIQWEKARTNPVKAVKFLREANTRF
jgi:hypothetical protein